MDQISIVNQSTKFSDADLPVLANVLQIQVQRDWLPLWGSTAEIFYTPSGKTPTASHWLLALLDNADQAGALGYHDTTPAGQPLGKVFVETTLAAGDLVSVTASHELLEMRGDPDINLNAEFDDGSGNPSIFYAYEVCLTGDTKIALLDGTDKTVRELLGVPEFWTYSCSEHGHIRAGHAHSVRLTRHDAPILKVTLDNGQSIRCTPEHAFMMRDGSYMPASQLRPGDSLMPLYRRLQRISENSRALDYEQVLQPADESWEFTHRIVVPRCPCGWVRHHVDFDRFNNRPDNFALLPWLDHLKIHQEQIRAVAQLPQTYLARSRNMKALNDSHLGKKRPELSVPHNLSENQRRASGIRGRNALIAYNKSAAHRLLAGQMGGSFLRDSWSDPAYRKTMTEKGKARLMAYNGSAKQREDFYRYFADPDHLEAQRQRAVMVNHRRWHLARGVISDHCRLCVAIANHKVVAIEADGFEDVYDFTVDRYHNFATSAGIFLHNCDAVEDDSLGYDITVPAGWQGAGQSMRVSNFVTPAWFQQFRTSGPFDFRGELTSPFQLLPGGYIGFLDLANLKAGWQQKTARNMRIHEMIRKRPHVGSRRQRRSLPRASWMKSTYAVGDDSRTTGLIK